MQIVPPLKLQIIAQPIQRPALALCVVRKNLGAKRRQVDFCIHSKNGALLRPLPLLLAVKISNSSVKSAKNIRRQHSPESLLARYSVRNKRYHLAQHMLCKVSTRFVKFTGLLFAIFALARKKYQHRNLERRLQTYIEQHQAADYSALK